MMLFRSRADQWGYFAQDIALILVILACGSVGGVLGYLFVKYIG